MPDENPENFPDGWLLERDKRLIETAKLEELPEVPRVALVEIANICNHRCAFCAYSEMTRPGNVMDPGLFRKVMAEAYELGVREVGLHGGSEPLTCRHLEDFIVFLKETGFTYVYFTTNGTLGDEQRFKAIMDAGIDSIKFSINGGDRETYKRIHGKDHFERALANLRFVSSYRKTLDRPMFLAVSFIEVAANGHTFDQLKALVEPLVDEVYHSEALNQSGQTVGLREAFDPSAVCVVPFNQLNISREGYLRGCCNDYQNLLAIEDAGAVGLKEAWGGVRARAFRRQHLEGKLQGTLCHKCMYGGTGAVSPINPDLSDLPAVEKTVRVD